MTKKWADRTTYQGKKVNRGTREIINAANTILQNSSRYGKEKENMTMTQGGYNAGGVAASAGTHDGGGAMDLTAFNTKNRVKLLRLLGVAASYRPYIAGLWPAHIHAIVVGDGTASPAAKGQVTSYLKGRNGLKGDGPDPDWRPLKLPILFVGSWTKNGARGTHYFKSATQYRDEPTAKAKSHGKAKKGTAFKVVATVKVGSAYWSVDAEGNWVRRKHLTTKKPKWDGESFPGAEVFKSTGGGLPVRVWRKMLEDKGLTSDKFTAEDRAVTRALHKKYGTGANKSLPNNKLWKILMSLPAKK